MMGVVSGAPKTTPDKKDFEIFCVDLSLSSTLLAACAEVARCSSFF